MTKQGNRGQGEREVGTTENLSAQSSKWREVLAEGSSQGERELEGMQRGQSYAGKRNTKWDKDKIEGRIRDEEVQRKNEVLG